MDIDPLLLANPLAQPFAVQHDFRQRFQEALVDIVEAAGRFEDPQQRADAMLAIASRAIDPDDVQRWWEAGRPLPRLEAMIGEERIREMNKRSLDALDQVMRSSS